MKLIINDDKLEIEMSKAIKSGSINYYNIECEFNSAWNNLTKEIIIKDVDNENGIKRVVVNGVVNIDQRIKGLYQIGAKGYSLSFALTTDTVINPNKTYYTRSGTEGSYIYTKVAIPVLADIGTYYEATKTLQISTNLKRIPVDEGAGEINTTDEIAPSTSEFESYIAQIQEVLTKTERLNVTGERVSDGVEITFTNREGTQTVRKVNDGTNGQDGTDGEDGASFEYNWQGTSLGVKTSEETEYQYVDLKGAKGDTGTGMPTGGTKGQILSKRTDTNYDTEWITLPNYVEQKSVMPTADSSNVNKIVEYIGSNGTYTNGYFYKNINTEVQESITATQTDNVIPLGTITLNNNTLKSQLNAGTHEFVYRPYDTVLNFMNLTAFPPVSYQVTRDSTFDRQPMIPNAPKLYSWVDNSNNFYVTDTLQPNALTKLYLLDIQTNDLTDTGATFISSNTPSQIEGRWTKKEGDVYTDVEISDYGIYLTSAGLPGNTIQVNYIQASNTYAWTRINVQPDTDISMKQNITDNTLITSNKTVAGAVNELSGRISNLQNIGRFLAIWNCTTGLPTSEPASTPYEYKTGDYFRVGAVSNTTNYMPNGSTYTGVASTTEYTGTETLSTGAVFYYDGSVWRLQASGGGGTVQDVQVDGVSVLNGGIANITGKENTSNKVTSISFGSTNIQYPSAKAVYDYIQSLNAEEVSY